jgi:hypothetical protein
MCFEALDCTPATALWPITARGIRARDLRRRGLSDLGEKRERGSLAAQRERCMSGARFGYQIGRFLMYTGACDAWGLEGDMGLPCLVDVVETQEDGLDLR